MYLDHNIEKSLHLLYYNFSHNDSIDHHKTGVIGAIQYLLEYIFLQRLHQWLPEHNGNLVKVALLQQPSQSQIRAKTSFTSQKPG